METLFTAAVQRALAEAVAWSSRSDSDELEAPALLLGLLGESECRAGLILGRHGIDADSVLLRWPHLARRPERRPARDNEEGPRNTPLEGTHVQRFSPEIQASLAAVRQRLVEYPWPLLLATEHMLLGLVAAEHEVSGWLRQRGVRAEDIEREIHRWYGHCPGPLPCEESHPMEVPLDPAGVDGPLSRGPSEQTLAPAAVIVGGQDAIVGGVLPVERVRTLRAIDAAANRAREGLRVVEDYVRFVLDDRHLTGRLKHLRHELAARLRCFPMADRLAARETRADVGTELSTPSERQRRDTAGVLAANFARLQESLRSLEEFAKVLDEQAAAGLKELRYWAYTLHRAVEITRWSVDRLRHARLYVLVDGRASIDEFVVLVRALVDAGVHVIQLRDKHLDDRPLLERARALRRITAAGDVLFIINDRPDLAALAGADGVHLGQEELTVKDARTIVGPKALVGVSAHSIGHARQAVLDGANYLGVGPTFPSGTKPFSRFPGPELLRAVAAEIRLPAFAIGGITGENLAEVLDTGIGRIAVSGAVSQAPDPADAARALLAMLRESSPARRAD